MSSPTLAGSLCLYVGGRLAPSRKHWRDLGSRVIEVGAVLYVTGIEMEGEPVDREVALPALRGLEYVRAYRREVGFDVRGLARAVKRSTEDPEGAFALALENLGHRLREYVNALLNHDEWVVRRFSRDVVEALRGTRGLSPAVAEVLKVVEGSEGERSGWHVSSVLESLLRWLPFP
ncbi:MAG: hypothetical protein ABGY09_06165 [Euryarchaeota archaeon]